MNVVELALNTMETGSQTRCLWHLHERFQAFSHFLHFRIFANPPPHVVPMYK